MPKNCYLYGSSIMEKYPGPVPDSPFVDWNPDPVMFTIPGLDHPVVWYGLFFALAFVGSHFFMSRIFKEEKRSPKDLDRLTLYVIAGTVIGARLGHCLFYGPWFGPDGYLSHPLNMLKVWEGGLASHGGAIGIITALWLYARKTKENIWWILDRIVVAVAFSGMCIRIGNLMNSEIVGKATSLPWGFRFIQHDISEAYRSVTNFTQFPIGEQTEFLHHIPARHPSQLYEALFCLVLLFVFYSLWKKKKYTLPAGFMFGLFTATLFTFRFCIEFTKEVQASFENKLPIDMGQFLSVPFVLAGIIIMIIAKKKNIFHPQRTELPKD
jgi:phosphatidylglycerol---prolipoprotein diacylglyceryl transferase